MPTTSYFGQMAFREVYHTESEPSQSSGTRTPTRTARTEPESPCMLTRKLSALLASRMGPKAKRSNSWGSDSSGQQAGEKSDEEVKTSLRTYRRLSLQSLFGASLGPDACGAIPEINERLETLEARLVEDEAFRMEVVSCLLANHCNQGHLKVRFILAVTDFESTTDGRARFAKGAKILELFTRPKSNFRIESIPPAARMSQLSYWKRKLLNDISNEACVQDALADGLRNSPILSS